MPISTPKAQDRLDVIAYLSTLSFRRIIPPPVNQPVLAKLTGRLASRGPGVSHHITACGFASALPQRKILPGIGRSW